MSYILEYAIQKRKQKEQDDYERQQKALEARSMLEERGLSPQEANNAVGQWVQTGQWNLPTSRTVPGKMEPGPDGKMMYGPAQPVQQPVSIRKREEINVPYQVGADGKITTPQMDESFLSGLDAQGYRVKPELKVSERTKPTGPRDGMDIYIDETGRVIKRIPNLSDHNETKVIDSRAHGGSGEHDPRVKAALATIAENDRALKSGKGVDAQLGDRAAEAAKFLKLPVAHVEGTKASRLNKITLGLLGTDEKPGYDRPAYTEQTPTPAPAMPPAAMDAIKKAGGKKVTFTNGQVWRFVNGKPMQVN